MQEEIQPKPQNKSTRSYAEWKESLINIYNRFFDDEKVQDIDDEILKSYYIRGLMPTVAFNELFNK